MVRTLKDAQDERYKTHYLCKCERCNADAVVEAGDFDNFYGIPEHGNDERAWRCPVCGHVTIINNNELWKHHCDYYGDTNTIFELTEEETKRAKDFINEHDHSEEFKKEGKFAFTAMGQQFSYEIIPGGLGNVVIIKCNHCGEERDITDYENW